MLVGDLRMPNRRLTRVTSQCRDYRLTLVRLAARPQTERRVAHETLNFPKELKV